MTQPTHSWAQHASGHQVEHEHDPALGLHGQRLADGVEAEAIPGRRRGLGLSSLTGRLISDGSYVVGILRSIQPNDYNFNDAASIWSEGQQSPLDSDVAARRCSM